MKLGIAGVGSFAPAVAAVVGSVALSLLILHPPPGGLLPGTAPADRGHVAALVLPAVHVSRPPVNAQLELPRPTPSAIASATPHRAVSHSAAPPAPTHRTPAPPPVQTVPTPPTQPVTTPAPPVVTPPVVTPPTTPTNNGRWSAPKVKTWQAVAAKQSERVQKGKPPWAGPKQSQPTIATIPAAVVVSDTSKTPPGQTKTPPGQAKKAASPHG
jgi:hypothetical protein